MSDRRAAAMATLSALAAKPDLSESEIELCMNLMDEVMHTPEIVARRRAARRAQLERQLDVLAAEAEKQKK